MTYETVAIGVNYILQYLHKMSVPHVYVCKLMYQVKLTMILEAPGTK